MIKIDTISYDDEYDIQIRICFENDLCSSSLEIYGQTGIFQKFAQKLVDFPFGDSKEITFEYGEDDDKWAYYLKIKLTVYDASGRILMNTIVKRKGDESTYYRCEIPIMTEVATVNELGRQLLLWKPVEGEIWSFPN
jgi:hypothetical protein